MKKNYTFKVIKKTKVVQRCQTHSIRRFINEIASINWQNNDIKAYLRISYGTKKDHTGSMTTFFNDGWYDNQKDFHFAFTAFRDEE